MAFDILHLVPVACHENGVTSAAAEPNGGSSRAEASGETRQKIWVRGAEEPFGAASAAAAIKGCFYWHRHAGHSERAKVPQVCLRMRLLTGKNIEQPAR
jgi:hypothetical protein